jgi:hypothetical protein
MFTLVKMGSEMEMLSEQEKTPGNKEACKRYYARNSKAAKRRVLLNEISRFGRISKQATLEKWEISIHDVIDSFRKFKDNYSGDTEDLQNKIILFRVLVGNML